MAPGPRAPWPPAPDASPPAGAAGPLSGTRWGAQGEPSSGPFDLPEGERYRAGALLGRGGMGEVVVVADRRLDRDVAQKSLLYVNPEAEARLVREARVMARLEHPGVVPVYDAGRDDEGRLCYRMRRVQGRTLGAALRAAPGEGLRLLRPLLDAARAVAYAHARGVVHRDLKPENILIGEQGEALVLDWGLAAELDHPDAGRLTMAGLALGTPSYMSPKQAKGEPARPEDDVWALGQVLRELIGEGGPPALAAVARRAQAPIGARYADAGALVAELEAWFEGRRVQAHAYTPTERLGRAVQRWRWPLAALSFAVIAALVVALAGAAQLDAARDRAVAAEQAAVAARGEADAHLALALVDRALAAALAGRRPEAEVLAAHALRLRPDPEAVGVLAMFAHVERPVERARLELPPGCRPLALRDDGARLACAGDGHLAVLDAETGAERWRKPLWAVAARFGPDGALAAVDAQGALAVVDDSGAALLQAYVGPELRELTVGPGVTWLRARNERYVARIGGGPRQELGAARAEGPAPAPVRVERLMPAGELATVTGSGLLELGPPEGPARWSLDLGAALGPIASAKELAASPSGRVIAIGDWEGDLIVIDLDAPEAARRVEVGLGAVSGLAVSADGQRIAVAGQSGRVRVWARDLGRLLPALPDGADRLVAWAPDGALITVGAGIRRWSLPAVSASDRLVAAGGLTSVRFSPQGDRLAAAGAEGKAAAWRVADGAPLFAAHLAGAEVIKDLAFTQGGDQLYVAEALPGQTTLLDGHSGAPLRALSAPLQRRLAPFGADGLLGFGWGAGPVRLDLRTGAVDRAWEQLRSLPVDLGASAEGDVAVVLLRDGAVVLLEAAGPASARTVHTDLSAAAVDVAVGGAVVAVGTIDALTLLRPAGALRAPLPAGAELVDLALSPAGDRVAVGLRDGRALVLSVEDGALLAVLAGHDERVASLDWSPDGALLATASWDETVRLWGMAPLGAAPAELLRAIDAAWSTPLHVALGAPR